MPQKNGYFCACSISMVWGKCNFFYQLQHLLIVKNVLFGASLGFPDNFS